MVAYSDHLPIFLSTAIEIVSRRRKKLFRFEAMWIDASECHQVISKAWKQGRDSRVLVMDKIIEWNKTSFGPLQRKLQQAYRNLEHLLRVDPMC